MNFEYKLNEQDLVDFNLFHITYSKLSRRSYFIQRYVLSLSFLVLPFLLRRFTNLPLGYWFVVFILLYVYWVAVYPKRLKKIVSRKISKMLAGGKNNSVVGTHSLAISGSEIIDKSEYSEARTQFSDIENIVEDKEHIFVYVNSNSAHIIPLRIFENENQKQEFLTLLRQKAGKTDGVLKK
ncbi:YcxB family protein [Desulfosporosinus youngiae]|uniref:YcxB-like C-terminal domain-containing protein n=1 Tax=Desulfosporosinus youngiae DSM 17734 TaxID=768710 RepID=H5Y5A9_9FIRM|nr:YcxB family protein [Desulfosporosinus youngiae]EHQ90359.1 hypothetical protein DesyoDRAFT_3330 [Desulfosporosinus youngiae DSM 17734]